MTLQTAIQELLQRTVAEGEIAGANALVLQHGQEVAYAESGWADVRGQKPIQRDTIFRIYSMTKPLVGAAVMQLMEQGKLDLAEPVSKYLHGFHGQYVQQGSTKVPVCRDVRIYDLLSMTSGVDYPNGERNVEKLFQSIGKSWNAETEYTTTEIINALGQCPLLFQPGTQWHYGASADVLVAIVEQVTGMVFSAFLKQAILDPLEMQDTAFYVPEEKRTRLATAYQQTEDGLEEVFGARLGICFDEPKPPKFEVGGCGMVSTLDDYAHFAEMLLDGGTYRGHQILRPDTVRYFTSGQLNQQQQKSVNWIHMRGYTYGNLMRVMERPAEAIIMSAKGEYGWDGWMGTYFANDPQNDLTLLLMTQRTDGAGLTVARKLCNVVYSRLDELRRGSIMGF